MGIGQDRGKIFGEIAGHIKDRLPESFPGFLSVLMDINGGIHRANPLRAFTAVLTRPNLGENSVIALCEAECVSECHSATIEEIGRN